MGCCSSRPRGAQAPGPQHRSPAAQDIAAAAQLDGPPPVFREGHPTARSSSNSLATSVGQTQPVALNEHFNEPLRTHTWRTKAGKRPWTHIRWESMREEFFHTRVTNRPEVWSSLKAVVELMDQGELETAQGILNASEITLPTGDLVDGAYDSFGNLYQLPAFVVSAPENMVSDDDPAAATRTKREGDEVSAKREAGNKPSSDLGLESSVTAATAATTSEKPSSKKGKAVAKSPDLIPVKARLSDRAQDVIVEIGKYDNVKVLIEGVAEKASLSPEKIRIAYTGKILKPNKGFIAQGWQPGHVVNALILP